MGTGGTISGVSKYFKQTRGRNILSVAVEPTHSPVITQKLAGDPDERGGIKGSHPIDGKYHPWQVPNWATKFFADALMLEDRVFGAAAR